MKVSTARYTESTKGGVSLLKKGVNEAAAIICSTLGPHGKNVFIGGKEMPLVTKDGATVARHLKPGDGWLRLGSDMLIDAALKTEEEGGDSTTTTCAVVQGIVNNLPLNMNTRKLCDELQAAGAAIDRKITEISKPVMVDGVVNMELLKKMAVISANNNVEMGEMVAELVGSIGLGGVIYVHPSGDEKTYTEIKKGYNYKDGVITPHFLPQAGVPISIDNPLVLLIEERISSQTELYPIYSAWKEHFSEGGQFRPLVIIASDVDKSALDYMVANHQKGFPAICIKAPGFGQERLEMMQDLQLITKTRTIYSKYTGKPISKFGKTEKHFGKADVKYEFGECARIYTGQKETVLFFEGVDVEEYCKNLDEAELDTEARKTFYRERKSKLRNGIGYIYVGASSHTELHNKGLQVDDCQRSCFAALEEGVLVGGGHSFVLLSREIDNALMSRALLNPFRTLLRNSDIRLKWYDWFKKPEDRYFYPDKVYNVKSLAWEPVEDTGVLDATKGVRAAIRNAISVSIEIIKSEHLIQWVDNK